MKNQRSSIAQILLQHQNKYPLMDVRDACKLIYQNVFGGGHMITDPKQSLGRIRSEYDQWKESSFGRADAIEMIGNGMCRIYLDCLDEGLTAETLNQMFVLSANQKRGTVEELEAQLHFFLTDCEKQILPFDHNKAKLFVSTWKEAGYPAISHSNKYRKAYQPAYRVIDGVYAQYYKVFLEIDKRMSREEPKESMIVAIDGMAGSGKSTLGAILQKVYDCNLFHVDDYFLQPHQRTPERLSEPGGNVDYERFKVEIYDQIEGKKPFLYQKYDCSTQSLGETVEVPYKKLNIIEGAYCAHPYFEDRADLLFFMEISSELQKERIGERNGEWMLNRFLTEWIPMEHKYFDTFSIREKAMIVDGSGR